MVIGAVCGFIVDVAVTGVAVDPMEAFGGSLAIGAVGPIAVVGVVRFSAMVPVSVSDKLTNALSCLSMISALPAPFLPNITNFTVSNSSYSFKYCSGTISPTSECRIILLM